MPNTEFAPGDLVYDVEQSNPREHLMVVTDAGSKRIGELDSETRRLVLDNDVNKDCGVDRSMDAIRAMYVGTRDGHAWLGDMEYTFPPTRLERAVCTDESTKPVKGLGTGQFAITVALSALMREVEDRDLPVETSSDMVALCLDANIDGKAIIEAEKRADVPKLLPDS